MSERVSLKWNYFSGNHEVEETEEADLSVKFARCTKNPGHTKFIPIKHFNLTDLPEGYRDDALLSLVKCLAAQTVRVDVRVTSQARPERDPSTNADYPFYNRRGTNFVRYGTGRVRRVAKFNKGIDKYGQRHLMFSQCPCEKCTTPSGVPSNVWWEIHILTAKHVVYDNHEAENSSCVLFYDDDNEDSGRVVVKGIYAVYDDVLRDSCEMICVTCDEMLAERLTNVITEYDQLSAVHSNYKNRRVVDRLTIIVSHPHGESKRVTVGHCIERRSAGDESHNVSQFTYSNSTCCGSSGALVYILGLVRSRFYYHHAHSGCDISGISFSGVGEEEYAE